MKLYSRLACVQKRQKCKSVQRLLSMIVGELKTKINQKTVMVNSIFISSIILRAKLFTFLQSQLKLTSIPRAVNLCELIDI